MEPGISLPLGSQPQYPGATSEGRDWTGRGPLDSMFTAHLTVLRPLSVATHAVKISSTHSSHSSQHCLAGPGPVPPATSIDTCVHTHTHNTQHTFTLVQHTFTHTRHSTYSPHIHTHSTHLTQSYTKHPTHTTHTHTLSYTHTLIAYVTHCHTTPHTVTRQTHSHAHTLSHPQSHSHHIHSFILSPRQSQASSPGNVRQ